MFDSEPGLFQRLIRDPVKVRERVVYLALIMTVVHTAAADGLGGRVPGLIYALTWLVAPVLALGYGYGAAFFIQYGAGVRKALIQLIVGIIALLAICVVLAVLTDSGDSVAERIIVAGLNGGLYGAVILTLGAAVALGLGRGTEYIGKRLQSLDDDDLWR